MAGVLNLKKNDILDLTKRDPSLNKLRLCAGWDVASKGIFGIFKQDFDLDLSAILLDKNNKILKKNGIVYYGNLKGTGLFLHGDNLTGEGDGDDEMISISLNNIPNDCERIIFAVTIYDGIERNQSFGKVKNAYVRLLNEDKNDEEICRYNLTEAGGDNTAIVFAELNKINGQWSFKAVGDLFRGSLQTLANRFR
ncbi:TerD family protein [Clostridium sp. HCP1S3_B4]|uniref:TerD family protein n=1 Tax=unclassified Clostridium TaxID=2614128 RepID=UPI0016A34799|nr:TerD family protein [Clostridiales bacterium]MDY2729184.1 TerD family protein [Clostridium sp.]NLK22488.1 TerD family protein [Clostridiales bacterium]